MRAISEIKDPKLRKVAVILSVPLLVGVFLFAIVVESAVILYNNFPELSGRLKYHWLETIWPAVVTAWHGE